MSCVVAFGLTSRAPSVKALMFCSTCGIGFAATKPSLPDLRRIAGDDAVDVLRLEDVAEIAADVLRVLVGPQAAGMLERDLGIFHRRLEDVGIEIAERGREQEPGAVEIDHALHGLRDLDGLGDALLLDHLDAGHLLDRGGAFGMRLVVTEIVARTDIDEAHHRRRRGARAQPTAESRRMRPRRGRRARCGEADVWLRHGTAPFGLITDFKEVTGKSRARWRATA